MKELTQNENTNLALKICELIEQKKGEAIEIFDVSKQSSEVDFMVVATASNTTLTKAICDFVEEELKKKKIRLLRRDGVNNWIVLDFNEILVHIFTPEIRDFYHLDKIWSTGKNIFRFEDIKKIAEKESKQKEKESKKNETPSKEKTAKTTKEKTVKSTKEKKEVKTVKAKAEPKTQKTKEKTKKA